MINIQSIRSLCIDDFLHVPTMTIIIIIIIVVVVVVVVDVVIIIYRKFNHK